MRGSKLVSLAVGIVCGPILCVWITAASCFCPGRLNRTSDPPEKKRFERRQKMAPRPLARRASKHRLSIPVAVPHPDKESLCPESQRGRTLDQTLSPLMCLPLELREMVYRYVLGDSTMHMILKEQKLGHLRCKAESALACPLGYNGLTLSRECCWGTVDSANIWAPSSGNRKEPTDGGIVPLLRSCRQMYVPRYITTMLNVSSPGIKNVADILYCVHRYSESINLLYSTNAFSFSDLDCLRYFSCTILPQRFALIQTLDIEWCMAWPIYDPIAQQLLLTNPALYPPNDEATWEETWRIIADMPKLRFIRVSLLYFDGFRDAACESKMLLPLRRVTRPEKFELHVSWEGEEIRDAPFELIRPRPEEESDDDDDDDAGW